MCDLSVTKLSKEVKPKKRVLMSDRLKVRESYNAYICR